MWWLGNEPSYKIAMETVIPRLMENEDIWNRFKADITEEFRVAVDHKDA